MASLQHGFHRLPPPRKGMARHYDSAAVETVRERRAAIESGRLKGRRLFNVPDSGDAEAEVCSGWSGVTDDSDDDDDDEDECCGKIKMSEEVVAAEVSGCCSSSSSSLGIGEIEKKRKMARELMAGGRWIGIVPVLVVVTIVAMRSCASGHGSDGHMNLVPT